MSRIEIKLAKGAQDGSSIVEFIVSLLVFIPLFIGIPLLGKYADIKHKTIEASRYLAWERTVYSEAGLSTRNDQWTDSSNNAHNEAQKTGMQLLIDAEKRFFGHPQHGLHQEDVTANPLWVNRKGESLLALAEGVPPEGLQLISGQVAASSSSSEFNQLQNQVSAKVVGAVARGGGEFGDSSIGGQGEIGDLQDEQSSAASFLSKFFGGGSDSGGCAVPGMNFSDGMQLGKNNYAKAEVTTPVLNFLKGHEGEGNDQLAFKASSAVLSNAWTAPSASKFRDRIDNVVPNQLLACVTFTGRYTFGLLSNPWSNTPGILFGEAKYSYKIPIDSPSSVLPSGLTYYDPDR